MPFFAVVITHHDLELRAQHLDAHVDWLDAMVERGVLVMSGPASDGPLASAAPVVALLILRAGSKGDALAVMATDPFFVHGVTDGMTVTRWDPIFGMLAGETDGRDALR